MAVVRNITPDTLTLFRPDAPPIFSGDEVTVPDEVFVGLAWPAETWEIVTPPETGVEDSTASDAHLWLPEESPSREEELASMTIAQLTDHASAAGIDLGGVTLKADIVAAILTAEGA